MNDIQKITPSGFFVLRTPLLPLDELTKLDLAALLERPEVREAIFLASPDLDESIAVWRRDPQSERGRRIERALYRYVARMCGRATPFGLFAGCTLGRIANDTKLCLGPRSTYRRLTRFDTEFLLGICEDAARDRELRASLRFRTNTSLYHAAGRIHYVEANGRGDARGYRLVAAEPSSYLDALLERARVAATPAELAASLVDDDVDLEEALEFVHELIDVQLLVSELAPALTGGIAIDELLEHLPLREAQRAIEELDRAGLGNAPSAYRTIAAQLPAPVELAHLFQVDLVKPATDVTLGRAVLAEIERGVGILHRIGAYQAPRDDYDRFREAFIRRYERQWVPLVEALDDEAGIGFGGSPGAPTSVLAGVQVPPSPPKPQVHWTQLQRLLLRKIEEAAARNTIEVTLEESELVWARPEEMLPLPNAFGVTAAIASASPDALRRGEFRVALHSIIGPSGARLLGRFAHADPALAEAIREHLAAEEALHPDAVFAEIVHLPEGRSGNILSRPEFRNYEIEYLGRSGSTTSRRLPVTDLLVGIPGGRVTLRSKSLGCEVIPRLSVAHNYVFGSLPVYRFLCSLQGQNVMHAVAWDWGPAAIARFTPRVVSGRLVLARARWRVEAHELRAMHKATGAELFRLVDEWRRVRGIPRFVTLQENDNHLPIDFENELSVETLMSLLRTRDTSALVEILPSPDELIAHGPEGRFVHEVVVPYVQVRPPVRRTVAPLIEGVPRSFAPGSEWLYAKLYAADSASDRLLAGPLRELVTRFRATGAVDRWFFIRYADPDLHLRVRLHGDPARLQSEVVPALNAIADGPVWKLQLDTYERELERYADIDASERVFDADSDAAMEIVALWPGEGGADARWWLALAGTDLMLRDLGLDLDVRRRVIAEAWTTTAADFGGGVAFRRQLNDRFRRHRDKVEALIAGTDEELAEGLDVLRARSPRLRKIAPELRDVAQLAGSYVHMHINRMLRSEQRLQEVAIYAFLDRYYEGKVRRG